MRPAERVPHADPRFAVLDSRCLVLEPIKSDAGFRVTVEMAIDAVLLEQRQDLALEGVWRLRICREAGWIATATAHAVSPKQSEASL